MSNAVLYISFKLRSGASVEDFLLAAEKLNNEYISKQKGFISWKQVRDGKTWADIITFETMEDLNNFKEASRTPNEFSKKFFSYLTRNPFAFKMHAFTIEKSY
jgi:hypothetical protein